MVTRATKNGGFALAITLTLLALIVIIVVAYLASTRTERSTSSVYANRLRAQINAESGLAAAIHVLHDNTRYGNYITAMPAPSPSPAPLYTEVYRPANPTDLTHAATPDDYLRLDNAAGEILVSRALPSNSPGPDPRPNPDAVPTPLASASPFALPSPSPSLVEEQLPPRIPTAVGNSYNFNQVVRIGSNNNARLVQPSPSPSPSAALGQWVNVRNATGDLIGRYAFFVEDESMKVNVNVAGNALGSRTNDLTTATPSPVPDQIQETDPGAVLPMGSPAPDRLLADTTLAAIGAAGGRLSTRSTLGLLNEWKNTFPDYAHMTTVLSKDDNTTARGWQRLDLNALAAGLNTPAQKKPIAMRVANWIHDAWTGPTAVGGLAGSQLFGDDRLRQQIAVNIVDYVAPSGTPTDMGDVAPSAGATPIPVIGIAKIPYIHAIEILFQASNTDPAAQTTTVKMKLQFRFINLFESDLDLATLINRIEVKNLPTLTKNGASLIDTSGGTAGKFTVTIPQGAAAVNTDLRPVNGTGTIVPKGVDGNSLSGVKTFQTDWLVTQSGSYSAPTSGTDDRPRFGSSTLNITVLDKNNARLDAIAVKIAPANKLTGYYYNGSSSQGDFVEDATPTHGTTQVASISLTDHVSTSSNTATFGDPRYRPSVLTDRWDNDSRTDATTPSWIAGAKQDRITKYIDTAEVNPRSYGVDWFDYGGDRPLAFIRNGSMLNIGELGNIATGEYPWRTLYFQHPERPANTTDTPSATDIPTRRSQSLDYVLADLFRASGSITRSGALNINTQQQFLPSSGTITSLPLEGLFVGLPVGAPWATATPQVLSQAAPQVAASPADRMSTGINLLVNSTTVPPSGSGYIGTNPLPYRIASISNKRNAISGETATPDNNPPRPYFQIGELAPTLSRLLAASEASDTSSSSSTSHVVYSALRNNPQSTSAGNYKKDFEVEQPFREVSNSITTRGNVFRILYVGQSIKDINRNGAVDSQSEVTAEYLGEAFVERKAVWSPPDPTNSDIIKTTDSTYKIIANRVVTE
jgi:hypothetical protein